jgi:chemotaxis response regulator CheB
MTISEANAPPSTHRDILVIETSSSGITALKSTVKELPADFPAAIFIVNHVSVASLQNQGIS